MTKQRALAIVLVLVVSAFVPSARAADGTTSCPDTKTCHFPSPTECSSGNDVGVWDGGAPGRGSVCVGAARHNVAYVGGDPAMVCGTVIVADIDVIDGPTAGRGSDPNFCPYVGWGTQVHDPAVAKSHDVYYLFGTGDGIPIWRSTDRLTWRGAGRVFTNHIPAWARATIPGSQFPWAPDISYFGNAWHLYYAVSTFGSRTSAIGVATNPTLDARDRRYRWTDHGVVIQSNNTTDYNAIDPNVVLDSSGRPSLVFGSFWGGIRIVPLDAAGKIAPGSTIRPIASRISPTWGIEASFVVRRSSFYYLFVSFDNCCRGSQSDYNIRVGRSTDIDGPYVDDGGVPMMLGGGRLVLASSGLKRGPGHNAVIHDGNSWRLFFHYYDAGDNGTAKLGILPITWTSDGWPTAGWSAFKPTRVETQR